MADRMNELDELTLHTLAVIEGTAIAEQRRRALAAYARQARQDPRVAEIVGLMLASRRERRNGGSNVIALQGGRNG
jgi:hypothetical protein